MPLFWLSVTMLTTACSISSIEGPVPFWPSAPWPARSGRPLPRPFALPPEAGSKSSSVVKMSHALRKGTGVFFSPMPTTVRPLSRMRLARRVKSLSLDTMQKPSTERVYRMSMASMIMAESVAFLPCV